MDKYTLFRQASEFTGFHKKLGALIEPYLSESWTMADIGCGLALLDFQVAGGVKSITAIDIDAAALAQVEKHIDEELAANRREAARIETLQKDAAELKDERWDVILMSFFADSLETADRMISLARHRSVVIMHGHEQGSVFDPLRTGAPKMTASDMERYLTSKGYGYRKSLVDLQFGQPFKTIEEIHEFLEAKIAKGRGTGNTIEGTGNTIEETGNMLERTCTTIEGTGNAAPDAAACDLDDLLSIVEERIIKTKRYDYPYYLPRNLHTAVFIIATQN